MGTCFIRHRPNRTKFRKNEGEESKEIAEVGIKQKESSHQAMELHSEEELSQREGSLNQPAKGESNKKAACLRDGCGLTTIQNLGIGSTQTLPELLVVFKPYYPIWWVTYLCPAFLVFRIL
jgi:hypothetical protein